jgi:hypothetical protein
MRSIFSRFPVVLILVGWCSITYAQDANISVGAITKYSGIATNQGDLKNLKEVNEFLNVLESQLAKELLNRGGMDYLDRMDTQEVFQELHLSSNAAFNPSSGGLKGLMGRLDFLVVVDSAEPTAARMRLIDVESGAVKALETCKRKTSLFGFAQDGRADCIAPFVTRTTEVAGAKRAMKAARLQQQAARDQAAKQKLADEQKARNRDQQAVQRTAQAQAEAEARARADEKEDEQRNAEAESRARAELDARIEALRPGLDDETQRLSSANDFWGTMSTQLASSGMQLRSDVRGALNVANADSRRCQELLSQRNVEQLQICITKLHRDLDKLKALN